MLPNLVSLNAEKNNVKDLKALNVEEGWKTLRKINLNFNKLT
jgi:protein phosphatase 1 regulatory subunit 7